MVASEHQYRSNGAGRQLQSKWTMNKKMKMSATMWHIFCPLELSSELSAGATNIFTHFSCIMVFRCTDWVRWLKNESQWPCELYAFLVLTTLLTDNYIAITESWLCRSGITVPTRTLRAVADLPTLGQLLCLESTLSTAIDMFILCCFFCL